MKSSATVPSDSSPTEWLARICQQHLLQPKWLMTERMMSAQSMKDAYNLRGGKSIQLRGQTLYTITSDALFQLTSTGHVDSKIRLADRTNLAMVAAQTIHQLSEKGKLKYFAEAAGQSHFPYLIARTISDLRLANVSVDSIHDSQFECTKKGSDVRLILKTFLQLLNQTNLVDYASALKLVTAAINERKVDLPDDLVLILIEPLNVRGLERNLLDALMARSLVMRFPHPPIESHDAIFKNLSRSQVQCEFSTSSGEVNEVKTTFQRLLFHSTPIPLDHVELLVADSATYVPLIIEQLIYWLNDGLAEDQEPISVEQLPVTFSDGIPCVYSRPGRGLRGWVRWIRNDCLQSKLVQLIREGLIARPNESQHHSAVGFSRLANRLRGLAIGFSGSRYLPKLAAAIASAEAMHRRPQEPDSEGGPPNRDYGLNTLITLQAMVRPLIENLPGTDDGPGDILKSAYQFLRNSVRCANRFDTMACGLLMESIEQAIQQVSQFSELPFDALDWLEALPVDCPVLNSTPQPGKLHVSSLHQGGYTGRPWIQVLGLDEARVESRRRMDPILLDVERHRISNELRDVNAMQLEAQAANVRALERASQYPLTYIGLSYSKRNLTEGKELFPSPLFMELYRQSMDDPKLTSEDFLRRHGPASGFLDTSTERALCPSNAMVTRLLTTPNEQQRIQMLESQFPLAAARREATIATEDPVFSAYDGYVPAAGPILDPTKADHVSTSRLESFGRCPRQFFFQRGLGIYPPDEWNVDPECWLDAMQTGQLMHTVFERFFRQLADKQRPLDYRRDTPLLKSVLKLCVDEWREEFPIPNLDTYERQVNELQEMCEIFLWSEHNYCRQFAATPWVLEASFGDPAVGDSIIDSDTPIEVMLRDGRRLRCTGRLDRVDRVQVNGKEHFVIWDYKTGSDYDYSQQDPFAQGRKLQPFLYLNMLRQRLVEFGHDPRSVLAFGYFFPSPKVQGKRMKWSADELESGHTILRHLSDSIAQGLFPATTSIEDCTFCAYKSICGDLRSLVSLSNLKASDPANASVLAPWRQLRGEE